MATDNHHIARLRRGTWLGLAAGLLAMATAGCANGGTGDPGAIGRPGVTPTDATPTSGTGGAGALGAAATPTPGQGQGQEQGQGHGLSGGSGSGTGSGGAQDGPRIVYFRIKQQATCPQGTNLHTVPGRQLIIEWKLSGAEQAELAVDGPGRYNAYPAQGSETFMFSCGGAPGTVERHTYKLTTMGGGPARSKTITATAKVNEIAIVDGPTSAAGQ